MGCSKQAEILAVVGSHLEHHRYPSLEAGSIEGSLGQKDYPRGTSRFLNSILVPTVHCPPQTHHLHLTAETTMGCKMVVPAGWATYFVDNIGMHIHFPQARRRIEDSLVAEAARAAEDHCSYFDPPFYSQNLLSCPREYLGHSSSNCSHSWFADSLTPYCYSY